MGTTLGLLLPLSSASVLYEGRVWGGGGYCRRPVLQANSSRNTIDHASHKRRSVVHNKGATAPIPHFSFFLVPTKGGSNKFFFSVVEREGARGIFCNILFRGNGRT